MKIFQIASVCLLVKLAVAAKGPVAEPVCDTVCPNTFPIEENWHIPYTNDCTKFCHCANDGNWMKLCPGGLHFNPELQVCDWPDRAGCVETGNPVTDDSNSNPTPKPEPDGCENVMCSVDDCFDFANVNDCQAYCNCNHGKISLKKCANGLHFNPVTGDCDFFENAQCESLNNSEFESGEDESESESESESSEENNDKCDNVCLKVWPIVKNNHLPIRGVCSQFCHCANDGNWVKDCPPGLHFNAAKQVCDWPHNAGCQ